MQLTLSGWGMPMQKQGLDLYADRAGPAAGSCCDWPVL